MYQSQIPESTRASLKFLVALFVKQAYSQLSLNEHLSKTDTSVRRTLRVGPCAPFFIHVTVSKLSVSGHLSKMVCAGPDGVRLRES